MNKHSVMKKKNRIMDAFFALKCFVKKIHGYISSLN